MAQMMQSSHPAATPGGSNQLLWKLDSDGDEDGGEIEQKKNINRTMAFGV